MSTGLRRFLFEDNRLARLTRSLAESASEILGEHWRNQPFGIDHFVYRARSGELRLRPFLECNPRWTMGRVALSLQSLLSPGRTGLWLWQSVHNLRRPPASWLNVLTADPFDVDDEGRLARGTVCTNDPDRACMHIGVLRVEKHPIIVLIGSARTAWQPQEAPLIGHLSGRSATLFDHGKTSPLPRDFRISKEVIVEVQGTRGSWWVANLVDISVGGAALVLEDAARYTMRRGDKVVLRFRSDRLRTL